MSEECKSPRRPILLAIGVLTCLVAAIFFPVAGFEFVNLDVPGQVLTNPHIRGLTWENVRYIFTHWCVTSYYPVRTLSFATDYQVWRGLNPGGFKLTNLVIHLTNVILVFWLVLRLYRGATGGEGTPKAWWDISVAAVSAGIFAVHPVVVEPVAWVAGREELLMTLGALGCIHFHLTARRRSEAGGRMSTVVACHAGAALFCVVACLSNAVGAVIALLVSTWDVLTLSRPRFWRIVRGTSALWLMSVWTILAKKIGGSVNPLVGEVSAFSVDRLKVVLNVYWLNLQLLVWPKEQTVDYPRTRPQSFLDSGVILGGLAIGLTFLVLWKLRRRKLVVFGLAWFGLALAPTSQIMPHHMDRADRFLYLPLVGLVVAVAMGLRPLGRFLARAKPATQEDLKTCSHGARRLQCKIPRNRAAAGVIAACVLVVLLLATRSTAHLQTWRNDVSLWGNCLRLEPDNGFAHSCLASGLAEKGQFEEAIPHFEAALRIDPDDKYNLNNYALRLATHHREELRNYDRAVRLAERGCIVSHWKDRKLRHTLAMAHMNWATASKREGKLKSAIRSYRHAVEADPEYGAPLCNLALLLATCPDPKLRQPDEAVELAQRACELVDRTHPLELSILAEVYAEAGRLNEAVNTTEKAIELTLAAGNAQWTAELRNRLSRYQKRIRSTGSH